MLVSDGEPLPTDCFIAHSLCGALHVDELEASLLPILRAVAAGAMPFSKRVIEQNLQQWRQSSSTKLNIEGLTSREREILELMLAGMDNQQIGTALHLGEQTVRNYVSKIYDKLHIGDSEKLALRMRMRLK